MGADELTIGILAKQSGLSRSALLYYDRLGLLRSRRRSQSNYRIYTAADAERLRQVLVYRRMGVPLEEIKTLLEDTGRNRTAEILQRRLQVLGRDILELRSQQDSIVKMLSQKPLQKEAEVINKDRWIQIMEAAGLSDDDMHNWHVQFEKMEPEAHQEFLESLGIGPAEIDRIRTACRKQSA
jgi:MerR family transcriptional regulator, thiopeptide resistance regulator